MLLVWDEAWIKNPSWLHRLSSSAGLVGKPSPQKFSSTKHCNFSIKTWRGKPLKASNSSTGVICCPKHAWCQCKTLRPGERNWNQDRTHQIAFHWEHLQMLTSRSLFWGLTGRRWKCFAWQLEEWPARGYQWGLCLTRLSPFRFIVIVGRSILVWESRLISQKWIFFLSWFKITYCPQSECVLIYAWTYLLAPVTIVVGGERVEDAANVTTRYHCFLMTFSKCHTFNVNSILLK